MIGVPYVRSDWESLADYMAAQAKDNPRVTPRRDRRAMARGGSVKNNKRGVRLVVFQMGHYDRTGLPRFHKVRV